MWLLTLLTVVMFAMASASSAPSAWPSLPSLPLESRSASRLAARLASRSVASLPPLSARGGNAENGDIWRPSSKRGPCGPLNSHSNGQMNNQLNSQMNNQLNSQMKSRGGEADDGGDIATSSPKRSHSTPLPSFQPRKKELWLPWPLGVLKKEYDHQNNHQNNHENNHENNHQIVYKNAGQEENQIAKAVAASSMAASQASTLLRSGKRWTSQTWVRGRQLASSLQREHQRRRQQASSAARPNAAKDEQVADQQQQQQQLVNNNGQGSEQQWSSNDGQRSKLSWVTIPERKLLFQYVQLQASVRLRQLSYVASDYSIHLPPASPTILLFYMLPRSFLPSSESPMQRLVKLSLTGATISWIHSECTKYRRFAPLSPSFKNANHNLRRPDLPPFLPEQWDDDEEEEGDDLYNHNGTPTDNNYIQSNGMDVANSNIFQWIKVKDFSNNNNNDDDDGDDDDDDILSLGFGTISSAFRSWNDQRNAQRKQMHKHRRAQVKSQLLAMQLSSTSNNNNNTDVTDITNNGHALITGASRGIGRAIAIELARYQIPLILVARDLPRLQRVAHEIQTYYGVPCHVLQADLSHPQSAHQIHRATEGLIVDILVNNAGVCHRGDLVHERFDQIDRMIQINVASVASLTRLYADDMKRRGRGRILFVSSMAGALPGCPGVAIYAATKSFEKSLASSLSRELENYGIGITCLLPGAVKTQFASRSDARDAACFHIPGYAKSSEFVAGEGVKAMMLGYPEVTPGWQNRFFVKFGMPLLPPRLVNMIAEFAWSSWYFAAVQPTQPHSLLHQSQQSLQSLQSKPPPEEKQSLQSQPPPDKKQVEKKQSEKKQPEKKQPVKKQPAEHQNTPSIFERITNNPMHNSSPQPTNQTTTTATIPTNDNHQPTNSSNQHGDETNDIPPPSILQMEKLQNSTIASLPLPITNDPQQSNTHNENNATLKNRPLSSSSSSSLSPMEESLPTPSINFFMNENNYKHSNNDTLTKLTPNSNHNNNNNSTKLSKEKKNSIAPNNITSYPSMLGNNEYDFRDRRLDFTQRVW